MCMEEKYILKLKLKEDKKTWEGERRRESGKWYRKEMSKIIGTAEIGSEKEMTQKRERQKLGNKSYKWEQLTCICNHNNAIGEMRQIQSQMNNHI